MLKESDIAGREPNHGKLAVMVQLITEGGLNINQISRNIGVYKETVRYWYRNLLKDGFTVQASPNYEKLGMKRVVMIVEPGELFEDHADALMYALGDLCYVVSFAKTLPDGFYTVNASVPVECLSSWTDFMLSLKESGVFRSITSTVLDWVRNVPMKAEMYDFRERKWDFDWSKRTADPKLTDFVAADREEFDSTDLAIIEQLQLDANIQLTEVAKTLKINPKTLSWHHRAHILGRGLLKGYTMNWIGTGYDLEAEKPVHRKHRYTPVEIFADGLDQAERIELMRKVGQLPYTWLEGCGQRSYYAKVVFPNEEFTEALDFLGEVVKLSKRKARCLTIDQAHALWFTLPIKYYEEKRQRWAFDQSDLLQRFALLVQKMDATKS
ncbi:MAG: winged helix-turn-helix domain-containing protein [Thaumarchaeota archaeon]|nr:winged helix-turn-helix domain-containing protein [Nitrososphaerota archaeon]